MKQENSRTVDQHNKTIPVVWIPCSQSERGTAVPDLGQPQRIFTSDIDITRQVVQLLDSAKATVIACSYLLADAMVEDAIYSAADRGVRVYLMLACEDRLGEDPDDDFDQKIINQHTSMLKRLAGKVMIRSARHYHAKVVLIDAIGPRLSEAKGLLLTANLTTEAMGGRNEELGVALELGEIQEMISLFKWAFFEDAEHQMLDKNNFVSINPLNELEHPVSSNVILSTSKMSKSIRKHLLDLVNKATKYLIVSSYGWQENHPVVEAICQKARQGVEVIILSRARPHSMRALMKLKAAGAKVYGFKWLHAKAIWINGDEAMVMSANLQDRGLDTGFEVGIKLYDDDATALKNSLISFLGRNYDELELNKRLGTITPSRVKIYKDGYRVFNELNVIERKVIQMKEVVADCASRLGETTPDIPGSNWFEMPAHKVEYRWTVTVPKLVKGAQEIFWEEKTEEEEITNQRYSPRVFRLTDESRCILIPSKKQMSDATKLKNEKFPDADIVLNLPRGAKEVYWERPETKVKVIKKSYCPRVFSKNGRHSIAISGKDEMQDAIQLRDEKFHDANIVMY